jgi:hypothetical protein
VVAARSTGLAVAVVAAACAGEVVDAPVRLAVSVTDIEDERPPEGVSLWLAGQALPAAGSWSMDFPDTAALLASELVVEARYGGALVDVIVAEHCTACLDDPSDVVEVERLELCQGAAGELVHGSTYCGVRKASGAGDACWVDNFCAPPCDPLRQDSCVAGEKCSMLLTNAAPRLSHIACVPDGTVLRGAACRIGPAGLATGYDDCAAGSVCVDGVCAPFCDAADPAGCAGGERCHVLASARVGAGVCAARLQ